MILSNVNTIMSVNTNEIHQDYERELIDDEIMDEELPLKFRGDTIPAFNTIPILEDEQLEQSDDIDDTYETMGTDSQLESKQNGASVQDDATNEYSDDYTNFLPEESEDPSVEQSDDPLSEYSESDSSDHGGAVKASYSETTSSMS